MNACRINIILALEESTAKYLNLEDIKHITCKVSHELLPESPRCFVRVVEHLSEEDFREFAGASQVEGIMVISEDLVAPGGKLRSSQLATDFRAQARQTGLPLILIGLTRKGDNPLPGSPPPDLDCVLSNDADLGRNLAEAVREMAARIWLTMPAPEVRSNSRPCDADSDIVIDFPRTEKDFKGILALRFTIYRALGYLSEEILQAESHYDLDPFDPNAIHLLARDTRSGDIVGCSRLIVPDAMRSDEQRHALGYPLDVPKWCQILADAEKLPVYRKILKRGPGGMSLPGASMAAYTALRRDLQGTHTGLRTEHCCEFSRLIVAPRTRGQRLARRLTEAAAQIAGSWMQRTIMLVECREYHRSLYERFGFQLTKGNQAESAGLLRTTAIVMWRDLHQEAFPSPHQPNAHVLLSALDNANPGPSQLTGQVRRTLPMEAWVWASGPDFTERSSGSAFELSLYNQGLVCDTVRGLGELLVRFKAKRINVFNKRGDSVEVMPAGTGNQPTSTIVPRIQNLLH